MVDQTPTAHGSGPGSDSREREAGYAHVKQKLDALGPEYAPLRGMVNEIRAQAAAKEVRDESVD